ncbi:MAG: hypothetical protein FJ320_11290 [SAR202 cluster bacterium]|nr:hypothetical protein [SAR202 cluster bacterium]
MNKRRGQLRRLGEGQEGQITFLMALTLTGVFMFFSLGLDAGMWYFDHSRAQNQVDAAALAAAQHLPAPGNDTSAATAAADQWLARNNSSADERACLDYSDRNGDGFYDTVRVCVRRQSKGLFASMSGVDFAWVSADATAGRVSVDGSSVMPWGIAPPDPTCDSAGEVCQNDDNADGVMEDCGLYPPAAPGEQMCPWGLDNDKLYPFMVSDHISPGNFGALRVCGNGASSYRDCISGAEASGLYREGDLVMVGTKPGSMGANTHHALSDRYADEGADGVYECDVEATPDYMTGLDPDGKAEAVAMFVDGQGCSRRLVVVLIIDHFPKGASEDVVVLGVATFGIAKWDRDPPWGNDSGGTSASACGEAGTQSYDCGMVWGYLIGGVTPPDFLLEIGDGSRNPFAPSMEALLE